MIQRMEAVIESMRPSFEAINWDNREQYSSWLSQAYFIAKRSTAYLGLCLFHGDDHPEFQARCTEHIAEETGHEKLILNDLKFMGVKLKPELPSTMAIYQTQHFRIVEQGPLSFLGYVFFLELLAPAFGQFVIDRACKGAPKSLSFLKVHTKADEDHVEKAVKIMNGLSVEQQQMIWTNFEMTRGSYKAMLEAIAVHSQVMPKAA